MCFSIPNSLGIYMYSGYDYGFFDFVVKVLEYKPCPRLHFL